MHFANRRLLCFAHYQKTLEFYVLPCQTAQIKYNLSHLKDDTQHLRLILDHQQISYCKFCYIYFPEYFGPWGCIKHSSVDRRADNLVCVLISTTCGLSTIVHCCICSVLHGHKMYTSVHQCTLYSYTSYSSDRFQIHHCDPSEGWSSDGIGTITSLITYSEGTTIHCAWCTTESCTLNNELIRGFLCFLMCSKTEAMIFKAPIKTLYTFTVLLCVLIGQRRTEPLCHWLILLSP